MTLYFSFCIHYGVLNTRSLASVSHHTVDPPYAFLSPPQSPFSSGICYSVPVSVSIFVWLGWVILKNIPHGEIVMQANHFNLKLSELVRK